MTPAEIAASLRRVCEIADMALQGSERINDADDRDLKRVEALVELLESRNRALRAAPDIGQPRRVVMLDDPEETARAQEVEEAASMLAEVDCATCHDTKTVMRKDANGEWHQTAEPCPHCAPPPRRLGDAGLSLDQAAAGMTSLSAAVRAARDAITRHAQQAVAVPEQIRYRDMYLRPGMELSAEQRNFCRAMSQNGTDAVRLIARQILDADPAHSGISELWSFGPRGSVRLGQRLDLWQYQNIANVAFSTNHSYSTEQIAKAQRFLNALPDQNRWRLEQEARDASDGPPSF